MRENLGNVAQQHLDIEKRWRGLHMLAHLVHQRLVFLGVVRNIDTPLAIPHLNMQQQQRSLPPAHLWPAYSPPTLHR